MGMGKIRRGFAAANTSRGLLVQKEHIPVQGRAHITAINGGPRGGRSDLLQDLSRQLLAHGLDVEFFHNPTDPRALDGIYLPAAGAYLVDGSTPAGKEVDRPALAESVHLGPYYDEAGLYRQKDHLVDTRQEMHFRYRRAGENLQEARAAHDEWEAYHSAAQNTALLTEKAEELIETLLPRRTGHAGRVRRLFAGAISADGPVHYLDTLLPECRRRIILSGEPGTGKATIAARLADAAVCKGYTTVICHCPFDPEKVDHVVIEEARAAITVSIWPHALTPAAGDELIDMSAFQTHDPTKRYLEEIADARTRFHRALQRVILQLGAARRLHDHLNAAFGQPRSADGLSALSNDLLHRLTALVQGEPAAD